MAAAVGALVEARSVAPVINGESGFTRGVEQVLERTEYRRCDRGEDYEDICRLRYRAYRSHGFVAETPDQVTSDSMDDLPNCYRFGVFIDGELVSTVRVHHITREQPWGPAMTAFGDILGPRLERGESFINPSLLAADPELSQSSRYIPFITLRLGIAANAYFDADHCLVLIRKEHTAFYKRVFLADPVGEPKTYPPFTVPVWLYGMDCAEKTQTLYKRFPFFRSTPTEQRLLFGRQQAQEPAPLTILPTAKYLRIAA